jgi:uncharacterized protein (DUF4415 family)
LLESYLPERLKVMKEKNTRKGFNFDKAKPNDKFQGRDVKISKTFRIDADIFLWLQKEAERTGIPYQTLMNAKLRESMNLPNQMREMVREVLQQELHGKVSGF